MGFLSRALSGSERNYAAYELEMYAVVRAVDHFRMFLLEREFLLRTDYAALAKLLRGDLPPNTRVERWILRLSEYMFRIQHQREVDNVIADVLSRLQFARGSVDNGTSSSSANTSSGKRGSTGGSSAVVQSEFSAVGRPITGSEQRSIAKHISKATVAADTVACVKLSWKDSCVTLQEAAECPSTTTLLASTAATYAANANAFGEIPPTTTPASNKDPIRMIRSDFSAERRSDSEILGGSAFILRAGTTASQAGTTAVFSNFPTDNGIITKGNQAAMIPANRGCDKQSIHGEKSNETITVGNFPCGSTMAATQCPRARTTALDSVIGSALHDFCNNLAKVVSESSGESDNDSVSDSSSSEYECESETEDSNAYFLLQYILAPAIDLPISREDATVEELAIPSAEEFADAQLQDPDLVILRK